MSYKHLAGRLIETQRSMLGQPAVTIAQSIEGLSVSADGNVTTIEGEKRAVVGELFERYTRMLGDPAERRLRTAAAEFEEELDLPPSLGGSPLEPSDEQPTEEAIGDDATSIEIQSPSQRPAETADSGIIGSATASTADATGKGARDDPGDSTDSDGRRTAVRQEYTLQQGADPSADGDTDLAEVYLMREEDGWHVPISVEEAIVSAIASETGSRGKELGRVGEYVETGEILSVLGSETDTVASFEVGSAVVVVHASGTIAVQTK
jgi:hypothetical protein